ncbi:3-hydroxyacyl-CoA dehydrogenase [Rhizobiaceae bacterium]|nr:3-hydroxyacyl-CoA dehydrogenase [Rhizobiaceae bacterium]
MSVAVLPSAVALERRDDVLVATIDNPPVNALSNAVRAGLLAAVDTLEADSALRALVIRSQGRLFSGGADVTEFGPAMRLPLLGEVIARLDACASPVVAAIHGAALGGGLEVALACNARVAAASARLGFPEVKLGILPGAGGIVRLPRLTGIAPALEMIAEGKEISAARALEIGVVDALAGGDLIEASIAYARRLAAGEVPLRRVGALPFPAFPAEAQAEARAALGRKFKGREAPQKAVELFAMAAETPFAEAAEREYAACRALLATPQSRALRHVFAAERAAARPKAIPDGTEPRPVERVGIVGPGTMGRGIAVAMLDAGLPVTLVGRSATALDKARAAIAKSYNGLLRRGTIAADEVDRRLARLTTTEAVADLAGADLVVETISEDRDAKRAAIAAIDAALSDRAILVTNTSFLDIEDLASATSRPQNFAGMHFFNPANLMRLVENVRTRAAAPDVLATLMALSRRLGKLAVLVGPSEGFVANRMLSKRTREALFLLEDGATPRQVDRVLTDFGFPVGPFALADMAGLDVLAATRVARAASLSARERAADIIETLVAAGRLGRKSGAGYYAYGEDGKAADDPATAELLKRHRARRGIVARSVSDAEVLERCLLALVNEGAKLVGEGAVDRASDIDVAWTSGLAFPAHLGGPMFWASEMGLSKVAERLDHYAGLVGDEFFAPAPLVRRLAATGGTFQ